MENEYPLMIFQSGEVGEDWVIVENKEDEAEAANRGYVRAGEKPKRKKAAE